VYQICSPSRSALIVGRYPFHVAQTLPEGFHAIDRRFKTIPDILKLAPTPYRSYHTGKWHMVRQCRALLLAGILSSWGILL
jgi:arylsulfatase A-like enzyme